MNGRIIYAGLQLREMAMPRDRRVGLSGLMAGLIASAIASGTFEVNAGTYRKRYSHSGNPRLNRSRKWSYATSYKHARSSSPFPNSPIR